MPSKTFLNLPDDKRNKIIECARISFSEKIFEKVKVVHICKMADIPRVTFYSYFSSLADLYSYLFFYVDQLLNFDDVESFISDEQFHHWEQFYLRVIESDQGQRIIFEDLKSVTPKERIHYHLLLSLVKQYTLNLLSKNELLKEYTSLSKFIS